MTVEAPIEAFRREAEFDTQGIFTGGWNTGGRCKPYRDGMVMRELPEARFSKLDFTQLFVNGKRQIQARYPNYYPEEPPIELLPTMSYEFTGQGRDFEPHLLCRKCKTCGAVLLGGT